jgi:hypothetical protein
MKLEDRLRDALFAGLEQVEESPDLFARVQASIDDLKRRRQWRRRVAAVASAVVVALAALVYAVTDYREGELLMRWWILELITTGILVAIVILLGPFIKRFGKSYAAEVFRSNPGTGKSFIVLTDFAYYLIFGAYVLFTLVFERPSSWTDTVNATQLKIETCKIAGIFLLMGLLHGANLLMLPITGRLLTLNRKLDLEMRSKDSGKAKPGEREP